MAQNRHITLIGLPGVGKTSIAQVVSSALEIKHFDIDLEIEKDLKMSVAELINKEGESFFRALEKKTLKTFLEMDKMSIISPGSGAVLDGDNRDIIKNNSLGIYLKCDLQEISERLNIDSRPLLYDTNKKGQLEDILKDREKLYQEVASIRLNISGLPLEKSAKEICNIIANIEAL